MNYVIDKTSDKPAYEQLYLLLRRDIVGGVFPYGGKMPSKRLLASETDTSVITTKHCYDLLCEEGYICAKERSGYYVIYRENELYRTAVKDTSSKGATKKERRQLADASLSLSFPLFAKTMRKVISECGEDLLLKTENSGSLRLREALAAYLKRSRGMSVLPSNIIIGAGTEYLYLMVAQLIGAGECVAIEDPSYEKIELVYEANGICCEKLPMGNEGIPSGALSKAKAKYLHITPFNSFPSGITATAGKRMEYIRWAMERDGIIIEDDYDSEFTISSKAKDTVYGMDPDGRVIYMNTFNRTIAPSMRIGYMILPDSLMEAYTERLGFYSCTVPVFEQYVIAEFIDSGNFERHINRVRRRIRRE